MAINLASKYSDQILKAFTASSFLAGNVSDAYDFAGVRSLTIYTPQTVDLNDYNRAATSNRFGTPTEMQDTVQELTMSKDKGFSITIDKGNNSDQLLIKEAGKMMQLQLAEKVTPYIDKYAFGQYFQQAGTIVGGAVPEKSSIVGLIFTAATALDNKLVPAEGRFLYIASTYYNLLRQATEFLAVDNLAEKALTKGLVGEIADMKVIKVPDSYLPANAYFLITYKKSVILPKKLKTVRILKDVQGIDGAVLEGRDYFDAFVLGTYADGVYGYVNTSYVCAAPTAAKGASTTVLASATASATIKYTLDGTDPRYSKTALTYSAAITNPTAGVVIKAYAYKDAMFPSSVLEHTCV